jgi:hypothetical protein
VTGNERERRLDAFATILLLIAALATSWSGYQATMWSSKQTAATAAANGLRTRSTNASNKAGQVLAIDVNVFTTWGAAVAHGDSVLARFLETRFRPGFARAFEKWKASKPLSSDTAQPTPFSLSEYEVPANEDATRLGRAADSAAKLAGEANRNSDGYVLDTVILATVMFFAGASQQPGSANWRLVLLTMASVACAVSVFRVIIGPRV